MYRVDDPTRVVAVQMGEENGIDVTGLDIEKSEIVEQGTADGVALSLARGVAAQINVEPGPQARSVRTNLPAVRTSRAPRLITRSPSSSGGWGAKPSRRHQFPDTTRWAKSRYSRRGRR